MKLAPPYRQRPLVHVIPGSRSTAHLQNKFAWHNICKIQLQLLKAPALLISSHLVVTCCSVMPPKRFSLADIEAKGGFTKKARMDQASDGGATLIAVARPWGSAFWAFEGAAWKNPAGDTQSEIIHIANISF